jgi:hypothetical protein
VAKIRNPQWHRKLSQDSENESNYVFRMKKKKGADTRIARISYDSEPV